MGIFSNVFQKKTKKQSTEVITKTKHELLEECRQNEAKIEKNITYLRQAHRNEEEIDEMIKTARQQFAKKNNLSIEELVEMLLVIFENQIKEEKKQQDKLIYELLAEEDIEEARKQGLSNVELEALAFSNRVSIDILMSSNADTVESYYNTLDERQKDEIRKQNAIVVFEACLRREVQLKVQNKAIEYHSVNNYLEYRRQSHEKGEFDYPKEVKDSMEVIIMREDESKPKEKRRLKDPEDIIKYQDRVDKMRATLPQIESEIMNKIYKI